MYLRHSTIRKDGKAHTYWRLVRSVRRNGKVSQETVAQLGELDANGRLRAKALARKITGRPDQYELFEASGGPERTVAVRLDQIRLERSRRFGDCWLAWTLWRALGLDRMCAELMPEGREEVSWPTMAAVLVMSRLCEPSSELHIAEDFYRSTAMEDILDLPCEQVNDDRLYRALDRLLPHKRMIEERLQERLGELFDLNYDLLLYDVTSTFFEGLAEGNAQAKRDQAEVQRLVDQRDELQRQLDDKFRNENNPFVNNGIAGQNVSPNQFNVPGQQPLPGFDPNVVSGNPFETGAQAGGGAPLDPNARPQVFEAGADPLVAVGNPTANLRSNATRQPATTQPATRGLASH